MSTAQRILMVLGLALSVTIAVAQEPGRLNLQTLVEKAEVIVDADGKQRTELRTVETAVPGDELIYTVTNPIPGDLRYIDDSAFGPGTEIAYSVDNGTSFSSPDELMVQLNDGEQRPATADDYTHIRWTLKNPLEAGARGFARYRAVVR